MSDINRVTAYLKVTAEFYDPESNPETVRACVEQDLEDAGYEVEVESHECADDRDYRQDYLDFVNLVTFFHFKKEGFQEPPSYPVAKAAFLGCLPEWRKKEKWISAKDHLPPVQTNEYTDYIVHITDDEGNWAIGVAEWDCTLGVGTWRLGPDCVTLPDGMYITHWMETPEPPEDETHDSD